METKNTKKRLLVFFTRHGERADQGINKNLLKNIISCDPELTDNGR
jgi:hypothetical protein